MARVSLTARNAHLQGHADNLANGYARFYDGATKSSPEVALSGNTLLAELRFAATAGTVSNGVLTFNALTSDASANASGTPTFMRCFRSDGTTAELDLSVGPSGGSAEVQLGNGATTITALTIVSVSSASTTFPPGSLP
jgi:hypothetical protein